jgi:hypothetical protein
MQEACFRGSRARSAHGKFLAGRTVLSWRCRVDIVSIARTSKSEDWISPAVKVRQSPES